MNWDGRTIQDWTVLSSNLTSGDVKYAVIDNVVWVQANGNIAVPSSSSVNLLITLIPTALRPGSNLRLPTIFDGPTKPGNSTVFPSGQIQLYQTAAAATSVTALLSWPVGVP